MNGKRSVTVAISLLAATVLLVSAVAGAWPSSSERTATRSGVVPKASIRAYPRVWAAQDAEVITMAEVETVWQAGADGDFNLAGNWSNGVPGAAADKVGVLNDTSHTSLVKNLDQSGAVNEFKLKSTPAFLGDIGGPGNPLTVKVGGTAPAITIRSPGNSYIRAGGAAGKDIIIDAENGFVNVQSELFTNIISRLIIKSGRVTIAPDCTITHLWIQGTHAHVILEDQVGSFEGPTTITLDGGTLKSARDLDDTWASTTHFILQLNAGEMFWTGLAHNGVAIFQHGGYLNYNPVDSLTGQNARWRLVGGWLDFSDYPGDIPVSELIQGVGAKFTGSAIGATASVRTYDLNEDWPQ